MKIANYQLDELLEQVNSCGTEDDVECALKDLINNHPYVRMYMEYAVNDEYINVDIDEVQYKLSTYPRSLVGAYLCSNTSTKIYKEVLMNPAVAKKTQIYQLKNLLEMLYCGEATVLEAIIKKNLPSLYSNITHEMICMVL